MSRALIVYSTSACELCERAQRLLASMPELSAVPVRVIDIADDAVLVARYGTSIPVVVAASGRELRWPFNADDVIELLA